MKCKDKKYKRILVSDENYYNLKDLGRAGDSFNDVLNKILKQKKGLQQPTTGVGAPIEVVVNSEHVHNKEHDNE